MDPQGGSRNATGVGPGKVGDRGSSRQPVLRAVEEVLPDYAPRMQLGAGSFGRVFLMEHRATGERVAVKALKKERILELGMADKVLREIRILLRLRHPHVIRLHNVVETPKYILLVMEYAENGELFDYITQRGRLAEGEARRIFQQIVGAVECCHSRMVVHRDLKPENILLDGMWRVKLADFGLGNTMREGRFLRTSCGSPNYAAPEVISGRLYCGPEVDVWGCGVVLFTLLCGRLPFDEKSHVALYQKIKAGAYSRPTHVTPAVQDLLARMLVVDPLARISLPEIRQHPWFLPWFLPQQLLAYQAEEEQRRQQQQQQAGDGATPMPAPTRTTVQVNASSIANLHAVRLPSQLQPGRATQQSAAAWPPGVRAGEAGSNAVDLATASSVPVGEAALQAALSQLQLQGVEVEREVAVTEETGRALPWTEDGTLRQRVRGRASWLPGLPLPAAVKPPASAAAWVWEGFGRGHAGAGVGGSSAGGVPPAHAAWEAMTLSCTALQRMGAVWRKLGPYSLACRHSPAVMDASAVASASGGGGDQYRDKTVRAGSLALGSLAAGGAAAQLGVPVVPGPAVAAVGAGALFPVGEGHSAEAAAAAARIGLGAAALGPVGAVSNSCCASGGGGGGAAALLRPFAVEFELQLYTDNQRTCWVDLCCTRGCSVAFLDVSNRFFSMLHACHSEREKHSASVVNEEPEMTLMWH